jgi:homoserine O-succinyltransferase
MIALINNMPDAALEDTELQFFDLLDDASGDLPIYLKLYSLTGIPRTDRGQRHLNNFYYSLDELWQNRIDGVIITGTEPRQPNLKDEPYWQVLADVFDWAERNTFLPYSRAWRRMPAFFTATASAVTACPISSLACLTSPGAPRHSARGNRGADAFSSFSLE